MNELNNNQKQSLRQFKNPVFKYKNQVFSHLQNKNMLLHTFSLFQVLAKYHYFRQSVWPT